MTRLQLSAWLAGPAVGLNAVQLIDRPLLHPQWWPFVIYDLVPIALLLAGAAEALRRGSARWLAAAWGFSVAASYNSLFIHAEGWRAAGPGQGAREAATCAALAVLLLLELAGLALVLSGPLRRAVRPEGPAPAP